MAAAMLLISRRAGVLANNKKMTETNRRARFYTLTAAGRKQLGTELSQFGQMIAAIGRVLSDANEEV